LDTCAFGTIFRSKSSEVSSGKKRQKIEKNNDKKARKVQKRRKIEKKVTKWCVLLCVFCKNCTVFSIRASGVKMGKNLRGKIAMSKRICLKC